jgi:hypothetical protein
MRASLDPGDLGDLYGLLVALCALLNGDEHPPSLMMRRRMKRGMRMMRRKVYSTQR